MLDFNGWYFENVNFTILPVAGHVVAVLRQMKADRQEAEEEMR